MIPQFPEFKNLELADKEEIEKITSQFPPYSDYHFISIYSWGSINSTLISKLNNNLILKHNDCINNNQFYSFIGLDSVPQTLKEIFDFLYQNKFPLILRWVPEETIACLNGIKATISEDRDYSDYVYNVFQLHDPTESKYRNYRKEISRFSKKYPNTTTQIIDLADNNIKKQIETIFKTWSEKKKIENKYCDPSFEFKALNTILSSASEFENLFGLGVFNKGEMIAFSIEYFIDQEYGCGLFWKANTNYNGIYQFLMKEIINLYHSKSVKFMNMEFDLGLESLKKSKQHYKPAFFLKKYTVEINLANIEN